ncbi:hypothetical protein [Crocosphaera sp. Alani8]|uniref:hypothetical protein n=1 Tax=Crocosphaera sp. Alani8 TaxID=3038952 RepID=UPI00313BE50D
MIKVRLSATLLSLLTLLTTQVNAQDPAPSLQDLVGVRGSSGEMELQRRGYQFIRTEKSSNDAYSYWREESTGKCLVVRTSDGRYQSLVYAPEFDCKNSSSRDPSNNNTAQGSGKNIRISFPRGSNCGSYMGRVNVGDTFLLSLAREQQLVIEKNTSHDYSVQAPNGQYLEVIQRFPNNQNQYWTGNQSGDFRVNVASVPQGMQIDIKFCAYTGEGAL